MYNFSATVISTAVQAAIMLVIPLIWWLVTARRQNFFGWLGWTRPVTERPGRLIAISAATLVIFSAIGMGLVPMLAGKTSNSMYTGMGLVALPAMLVGALVQTSFLEECVFRGFLLKRTMARFGFIAGNSVQAVLFGAAHMVPLWLMGISPFVAIISGLFSGTIAAVMGYINERLAGGSLVPGYAIHAASNVFGAALVLVGIV